MLARNDAIQRSRQGHDSHDRGIGLLKHAVIIAVDREIGMHVTVAGMHV